MKTKVKSYKAKAKALKISIIKNETTLKEIAEQTDTSYHTMLRIGAGKYKTSELRAKVISNVLNEKLEDIFEVAER